MGISQHTEEDPTHLEPQSSSSLRKTVSSWRANRTTKKKSKALHPRTQQVFEQAVLYVMAFYLTHIWSTATRIVQQVHPGRVYFQLAIFHAFIQPLQGFTNFLVYQRPRFGRIRSQRPELPYWHVVHRVLWFSFLPPLGGSGFQISPNTQSRVDVNNKSQVELSCYEDVEERERSFVGDDDMRIQVSIRGSAFKLPIVDPSTDFSEDISANACDFHVSRNNCHGIELTDDICTEEINAADPTTTTTRPTVEFVYPQDGETPESDDGDIK
jgi:hypothetical protein